jgi:hypothetical protein
LILLLLSSASLCRLLPLFFVPLSTVFLPLCSGFVEVLLVLAVQLVAAKRKTGGGPRRTLLQLLCIFFFFLLPSACSSFTLLSLFLS